MDVLLRFIRQTSQRQFLKMCSRWISFISREKYFSLLSTNFLSFHLNVAFLSLVTKLSLSLRCRCSDQNWCCYSVAFSTSVFRLSNNVAAMLCFWSHSPNKNLTVTNIIIIRFSLIYANCVAITFFC